MTEISVESLIQGVEGQYDCKATYREVMHVTETFEGEVDWDGDVYIFDLEGHPDATTAYAWSSPVIDSEKRKIFAVLNSWPIQSAQDAVRAAIANDYGGE